MLLFYLTLAISEEHSVIVENIYRRWHSLMYNIALGILHDEALAEDAVHETMLLLIEWSRTHNESDPEKMKGLIYLIVRQRALHLLKQQRRAVSLDALEAFEPYAPIETDEGGPMMAALGRLKVEYREILQLRYLHELPLKEIANLLGIRLSTAQKRLHRARQAIKTEVEKHTYEL